MSQRQLPVFPDGIIPITPQLSCGKQDGRVIYFHGALPVFSHAEADRSSFRMITAQFCVSGAAKQAEIARAFGVTTISLKRAVKRYREQGPKGFYTPRPSRGPAVLTPAVLTQAQQLFAEGLETTAVAQRLGLKRDTLAKAVAAGRLHKQRKKKPARWC